MLFALDAERAHNLTLSALGRPPVLRILRAMRKPDPDPRLAQTIASLDFRHPVGLAAGLDKHGTAVPAWAALGFSFVEIGTVTPRPQPGNPKPRLFRLPSESAIINRFGFNSVGGADVARNLAGVTPAAVRIGINLGKNKQTANEAAADDYCRALEMIHAYAEYIVVNVSSPNTAGLRDLQNSRTLRALVEQVVSRVPELTSRRIPVLVKVAPDMADEDLLSSAEAALEGGAAGIVATNTTISREGLSTRHPFASEGGGMSGRPLRSRALAVCRLLYRHVGGRVPIIGVGGIFTADDAYERMKAGASAVQLYTALIYEGPGIVSRIVRGLSERIERDRLSHISEVIGLDVR